MVRLSAVYQCRLQRHTKSMWVGIAAATIEKSDTPHSTANYYKHYLSGLEIVLKLNVMSHGRSFVITDDD